MKIYADKRIMHGGIDLFIISDDGKAAAKPILFEEDRIKIEDAMIPPTLTIRNKEAQELVDQLWQCGLRPSEGAGSAGALRATEKHLEDMRKLVFETD